MSPVQGVFGKNPPSVVASDPARIVTALLLLQRFSAPDGFVVYRPGFRSFFEFSVRQWFRPLLPRACLKKRPWFAAIGLAPCAEHWFFARPRPAQVRLAP